LVPRIGDAGPADASAACLAAVDHDDFQYIQDEVFGVGVSMMYKSCSFGSCHDTTPAAEADLNLTPCPDNAAAVGSSTCNPASPSYDEARCCETDEYDAMLSYERLVNVRSGQHPDYELAKGMGDSIAVMDSGGVKTATLTDPDANFDSTWVDHSVVMAGSAFSGNRGTFRITAVPSATTIQWRSQSARAEAAFPGTWQIVVSGAGDSLAFAAGEVTLTDASGSFDAMDYVGQAITLKGATTSANNGSFDILSTPDATTIVFANPNGVAETFNGTWRLGRNMTMVVPGDPANSYLLIKLGRGDQSLRFGDVMPQSSSENATLCEEKIDAIERWIAAGASSPGGGPPPPDAAAPADGAP
jgi:hypothetical protein